MQMLKEQLDRSYQELITLGCDRRLLPGANGLNPYGASVLPRDAIALGSCSCSSPSLRATNAAKKAFDELRTAEEPSTAAIIMATDIRDQLRKLLSLQSDIQIAFAPSGTDVELLISSLVAAGTQKEIVNVIVGPNEVGSGTVNAAAGRHYDTHLPRGDIAVVAEPVNAALASRIMIERIAIRDDSGRMLSSMEIDAAVVQAVADAIGRGSHVILHLTAHSKTGIHAPTLGAVDQISRGMSDDVTVVVDAAQGRLDPSAYQLALDRNWLVSFTGSKFFGGPPFAGALFVPPNFQSRIAFGELPDGIQSYFGRLDIPASWTRLRESVNEWSNLATLLRWHAALAEMDAYFAIASLDRERITKAFKKAVQIAFRETDLIDVLPSFSSDDSSCLPAIESVPTVYSLDLRTPGQSRLGHQSLKEIHRRLNAGLRDDQRLACFHLGQPVQIGSNRSVLRLAVGAPLLIDVASNEQLGSTLWHRLDWLEQMIDSLAQQCHRLLTVDEIANTRNA